MSDDLATQETSEPSMDETIAAKWAEIEARGDIAEDAPEPAGRDEKGRFAAKIPEPEQSEIQQEEIKPARKPPSSWKKEAQERYSSLDPLFQDEIDRREADFHKGIEAYKQKAQIADEWDRAIQPYMQTIQQFGIPPQAAISNLLAADNLLRNGNPIQKQQYFMKLAQDYGVDLTPQPQQEIDPKLQPLYQQVQGLTQRLQASEAERQQQIAQAQQQEQQKLNSQIAEFAKANEHFEAVRGEMAALLQAGAASDLNDAYQKAIWANPDVRAALLAKQQEQQKQESQKKVQEAKKMSQINVKKKGTFDQAKPIGSMDETIRETAQRLGIL